jgi:hypothetical protein
VPFHVELSSSLNHVRVFNLSRAELLATVVEPWLANQRFELAESEWTPSDSSLTILEGRHLGNPELAFGQGWSNAQRSAENVTRHVLETAPPPQLPDAFVVETERPEAVVAEMVAEREVRPVAWAEAAERIDRRDPSVAAVILVVRREPGLG